MGDSRSASAFRPRGRILTLINSFSLNARPLLRGINRLLWRLTNIVPSSSTERLKRDLMRALWKLLKSRPSRLQKLVEVTFSLRRQKRFRSVSDRQNALYMRAIANYIPPKLNCSVVAVVSKDDAGSSNCREPMLAVLNAIIPLDPWKPLISRLVGVVSR